MSRSWKRNTKLPLCPFGLPAAILCACRQRLRIRSGLDVMPKSVWVYFKFEVGYLRKYRKRKNQNFIFNISGLITIHVSVYLNTCKPFECTHLSSVSSFVCQTCLSYSNRHLLILYTHSVCASYACQRDPGNFQSLHLLSYLLTHWWNPHIVRSINANLHFNIQRLMQSTYNMCN